MKVCQTGFVLFAASFSVWGCATRVEMPSVPLTHPANREAPESPKHPLPRVLEVGLPAADPQPGGDPAQHDHMQQQAHTRETAIGTGESGGMMSAPHAPGVAPHGHESVAPRQGTMSGSAQAGAVWRCPVHAGETSAYVGNCMVCGRPYEKVESMAAPREGDASSSQSAYMCTMHPGLPLGSPGLCPVCGFTLIKRKGEGE